MKSIKLLWLAFFALIMMVTMSVEWNTTQPKKAISLIKLELAKEKTEAIAIVSSWNIEGARLNTYIDFLFIIAYSSFLFAGVYRFSSMLKGWINPAGKLIAYMAPLAGVLDYIENFKMLKFLNNQDDFSSPFLVSAIKWGIAGFLFLLLIFLACANADQQKAGNKR